MTPYNKPHLYKQVKILKSHGLIMINEEFAVLKLKYINYYRLSTSIVYNFSKKCNSFCHLESKSFCIEKITLNTTKVKILP